MARKRKGDPVNGWVAIDKPEGMTSTAVVGAVRRAFNARKAGHAGTLDPLATGLLAVALGEATKTVEIAMATPKVYCFTVAWGEERDTDDLEGTVTRRSEMRPGRTEIEAALARFVGEIEQVPPRYSAVKIGGERAYDLARDGMTPALAPRRVTIHRADLIDVPDTAHAVIEVLCGRGTYVRALARDLGRVLGTAAHVAALRRTRIGPFTEETAISLDKLNEFGHIAARKSLLLPVETPLDDIPALAVSGADAIRLKRGQSIRFEGRAITPPDAGLPEGTVCATNRGTPVALGYVRGGEFYPARVFNLPIGGLEDVDYA